MLDRKLWPSLIYMLILFVLAAMLWQSSTSPEQVMNVAIYSLYSNTSTYVYPIDSLPDGDYQQLINLTKFNFTILNLPCNDSSPVLLVLVHSNPVYSERRRRIRETWGKNSVMMKVLFMTGLVPNISVQTLLDRENKENGDLVQGSFDDAYRNMTYKHVMVFKYAIYHCPQAKYLLKTDDDVFVNIPQLLNFLTVDLSPFGGSGMLFCSLRKNSLVLRSWRSKWRVSFKEYPAKIYPPYCPGWAVLYSQDVVFDLYKTAQKADYFWIDDVHITGTLVEKRRISHINIDKLVLNRKCYKYLEKAPGEFNETFLYGAPNSEDAEMDVLWKYVRSRDMNESLLQKLFEK